ncbi:aldo/keto reductase [Adlercreutzia wanghongyangiae]|uniref:aldo/keto reductase n=1 Tax=Adlercreutzia wanghongyangiae TaxID=3111451 RepID=UPI002DBBD226|nr:aldo/keto reductase [Adlercreutzia sp. R21]
MPGKNEDITRRGFVKGAAGALTIAALGMAGCVGKSEPQQSANNNDQTSAETLDANEKEVTTMAASEVPQFDLTKGTVELNNGITMPVLGIGTYILSSDQAERSVTAALDAGMRLIDTARIYGNEDGVGRAIAKSSVPRDEIFLTTKLWTADFSSAANAIDASLRRLNQDYIDLLLLHHEAASDEAAYRAMEDAVAAGKVRSIGLSNFYESGFERMLDAVSIPPAVLQNETQPYFQERAVKDFIAQTGTVLEAWFPLGGKGDCRTLFADPVIAEVATNHGVSPAQVIIRWHLQNNNVCIPGSSNPEHIREDADVFGFSLTADEMAAIDDLDRNHRFASY